MKDNGKIASWKSGNTSSAAPVTASKPIYEKNTTADPASIPFTPKGKNLQNQKENINRRVNDTQNLNKVYGKSQ